DQQRNLVVRCRPQCAGADEVEVAVADDRDRESAMLAVRERAADRRRRVVADAEAAAVAVVAIELVVIEQAPLPLARELMSGDDRPVVVLYLPAELGHHARYADRAGIPTVARGVDLALADRFVCSGDLRAASRAHSRGAARALLANLLDQRRQRGFAVCGNRDIDLGVVAEVVDVVPLREVLRADADRLAARSANPAHRRRHVVDLEPEDDIRSVIGAAGAIQRVPRREVLPRAVATDV